MSLPERQPGYRIISPLHLPGLSPAPLDGARYRRALFCHAQVVSSHACCALDIFHYRWEAARSAKRIAIRRIAILISRPFAEKAPRHELALRHDASETTRIRA